MGDDATVERVFSDDMIDALVEVVERPHEYEKSFTVRRLSVAGVVLKVDDPYEACRRIREALASVEI